LIELNTKCEGWFSLSAFKVDSEGSEITGSRRKLVPPFRNLITDAGLERMGDNSDWMQWCQVGSGSTAPTVLDTGLVSRVAGTSTQQAFVTAAQNSEPYYLSSNKTYRFAEGVAAGNLSEVGVGWLSIGGLFSRALILDAGGVPTTITVLADELLDVTYRFRQYPPSTDSVGTITLRGIVHDYVGRASNVASFSPSVNWGWGSSGQSAGTGKATSSRYTAQSGPIGAITTGPFGASFPASTLGALSYSAGSLYRDFVIAWDNNSGNVPDGIGAVCIGMGIGAYQFGFTPKIMKTSDDTLSLTFRHSWARKTL
jgi:hypothetical protein